MAHLENCPCCNSANIKEVKAINDGWRIYCENCGISTWSEQYRANAQAIWNRRAYFASGNNEVK